MNIDHMVRSGKAAEKSDKRSQLRLKMKIKWLALCFLWYLAVGFWLFNFLPGAEDPFPLSPQRASAATYSQWRSVGYDQSTGSQIYERTGQITLELHTGYFIQRKVGTEGDPYLQWCQLKVRPWRVCGGLFVSTLVMLFITWTQIRKPRKFDIADA
jgi:hypothetical protein